ncbi:tRNA lysidine(34) synthetase TilS [Persicimonas caeni]|nr:tRNA lysidine(34) synthetase TilS [Persicimonas caeni]
MTKSSKLLFGAHSGDFASLSRHLPDPANGLLVALSGGLDSTVLLDLLRQWAAKTGAELAAVHVDHQLRPSSKHDAAFCRRLCHQWGIPLVLETLDIARDGSTQESARVQRYAAIAQVAQRLGLGAVATAHHADDALETALLNFRRGTSSGGLAALLSKTEAPIPAWPDLELVRPLVEAPKARIHQYAEARGLEWVNDPTNLEGSYERNRLRHDVLPGLTDDGALLAPMLATLENLASERDALESIARTCLEGARLASPDAESIALDCAPLRKAPRAVAMLVLQRATHALPAEVALTREHLQEVLDAIESETSLDLAVRGAHVSIERGFVIVEVARGRGGKHLFTRQAHPIPIAAANLDGTSNLDETSARDGQVPWFGTTLRWKANQSVDSLVVRGPRPGDRLDARGLDGHKRVVDVLKEAGVPRSFRWRWPCLVHQQKVEWICGLRQATREDDTPPDTRTIRLFWDLEPDSVFNRVVGQTTNCFDLQYF